MTGLLLGGTRLDADAAGRADHLNALRAGVLGANDGIVSVAAIVIGIAGATAHSGTILLAGLAALIGGALSMALGEYVSVSSQRDSERATRGGARGSDEPSPWSAGIASALSFTIGGVLPLLAMVLMPLAFRIPITVIVVIAALAGTGAAGASLGGAPVRRATVRVVIGGTLALAATYAIGHFLGTSLVG